MAKPTLTLYQIYYRADQLESLDSSMTPYDNEGDLDPLLEFNVFRKIHRSGHTPDGLWGALSWKFGSKTGITGHQLATYIDEHPGYDVYFCNPFPEFESIYQNLWVQGETAHPEFISLAKLVYEAAGIAPEMMVEEIQPATAYSSTNAFVGTARFWGAYINYVETVLERLLDLSSERQYQLLHSSLADRRGIHAGATYLPFIVERLFSLFMSTAEGRSLRACKYPVNKPTDNAHLRHLCEMKDLAWRSRSVWLVSCWVNYRNLFLTKFHGEEWARTYLPVITPKKVVFSSFSGVVDEN